MRELTQAEENALEETFKYHAPSPAGAEQGLAREFVVLDHLPLEELLNELERVGGSMALWNSPPNTPESWGDLEKRRLAVRAALLRKDAEHAPHCTYGYSHHRECSCPEQLVQYAAIREAGKVLARTILEHTVACADSSAAVRKVREAVMTANAAVALQGVV